MILYRLTFNYSLNYNVFIVESIMRKNLYIAYMYILSLGIMEKIKCS